MRRLALIALVVLAGCGDKLTEQEKAQRDARDVALVEKANRGTAPPISPEPILYPDIEANKLYGLNCAFVPDQGGLGAILVAMTDNGYMKLDGKVVNMAADRGSPELMGAAHSKYVGKEYVVTLVRTTDEGQRVAAEAVNYPGKLQVRAANGDTVYDRAGQIQCGS